MGQSISETAKLTVCCDEYLLRKHCQGIRWPVLINAQVIKPA